MVFKPHCRWGDVGNDEEILLPRRQVIGPDKEGIKVITEWRKNEDGSVMKTTQTVRVKKQPKTLSQAVAARRGIEKFGDAACQNASDHLTVVCIDKEGWVFLERANTSSGATYSKQDGSLPPISGDLASLGNACLIVCRICCKKGDHWTSKCPFRNLMGAKWVGEKPPDNDDDAPVCTPPAAAAKSSYIPPSMRGGAVRSDEASRRGSHENSIRVSNLSEDTCEQDLQELFRPFGPISRTFVVFDRNTGLSRGFAFINFVSREDAERAINKLDGYGYDNLILRVEWATPRAAGKY